jgi:membrane protein
MRRLYVRRIVPRIDALFRLGAVRTASTVMYLYGQSGGGVLSSGLAARALFALLPALLLLVAGIGFVIRDPATEERLFEVLSGLAPPVRDLLSESLRVIADGALQVTLLGVLLLLWAAAGFFQTLDDVFAVVLGERHRRGALGRAILGVIGTLVALAAIGGSAVVGVIAWNLAERLIGTVDPLWARLLLPIVVALVVAAAIAVAYRLVPKRRPSWRAISMPAIVAGVAISLLTQLFTLIAPQLAGVASLYGAIAAVFVVLAWLQLGAQAVVIGIVWVGMRAFGGPEASSLPWPAGEIGRPALPVDGAESRPTDTSTGV